MMNKKFSERINEHHNQLHHSNFEVKDTEDRDRELNLEDDIITKIDHQSIHTTNRS